MKKRLQQTLHKINLTFLACIRIIIQVGLVKVNVID